SLLTEALACWQGASLAVPSRTPIDVRIANLPHAILRLASGNAVWLDFNAAGWGWFYPRPGDDSGFLTSGDQAGQHRMDLLTVPAPEEGHLLGGEYETDGLMAETLTVGTHRVPSSGPDLFDGAALDRVFADGKRNLAAPFFDRAVL